MTTGLVSAIGISLVVIIAYLVFLLNEYRRKLSRLEGNSGKDSDENREQQGGRILSENPTYKSTKTAVAQIRSAIDDFRDHLDSLFVEKSDLSREEWILKNKARVDGMLQALEKARELSGSILSKVGEESQIEVVRNERENTGLVVIRTDGRDERPFSTKMKELMVRVQNIVDKVSPCIAGFYLALTLTDEHAGNTEAAIQIALASSHLEEAIEQLSRIDSLVIEGESRD